VLRPLGHSIEARIYAEDPAAGFLPTGGRIHTLRLPPDVRVDSGVAEGGTVGSDYDPMLAKVIVWGRDRPGLSQAGRRCATRPARRRHQHRLPAGAARRSRRAGGRLDTGLSAVGRRAGHRRGAARRPAARPRARAGRAGATGPVVDPSTCPAAGGSARPRGRRGGWRWSGRTRSRSARRPGRRRRGRGPPAHHPAHRAGAQPVA
jgi:acetyl-CoA/propionyl-CoA carboxylase biotin carboxyl carrier protein